MESYKLKTVIHFGEEALERLTQLHGEKIFIVADPFMISSGKLNDVTMRFENSNCEIEIFSDVVPDPPIEVIVKGVQQMAEFTPDIVIGIGGGSAIDTAKAMCYINERAANTKLPKLIAIPTTSGTGSEVTSFSIISDKSKGIKYTLIDDIMIPDEAILSPELVKTTPKAITADTGMDVLTHALEAYVSTSATDFTDALAEKAVYLVFENLKDAYDDGLNLFAREKMHNASCLAGMAFNHASLGINHSIAHIIGGKFSVPHGRANAIILPHVVEFNSDIQGFSQKEFSRAAEKYAYLSEKMGFSSSNTRQAVKNFIKEIEKLMSSLNMPQSLKEAQVDMDEFNSLRREMAEIAMEDRCTITNPRKPTIGELEEILVSIY